MPTQTAAPTNTGAATPAKTAAQTATATATATPQPICVGDCNTDGQVMINELLTGVNIALGTLPVSTCPAFENAQGKVDVAQLVHGVHNALYGCTQ
jgi:hypothetical protein